MTNPTLDRAHVAAKREIDKLRQSQVEIASGRVVAGLGWANLNEVVEATTHAVLMAVRLQTTDGEDYVTSMDEVMFNERLDAILAEGE